MFSVFCLAGVLLNSSRLAPAQPDAYVETAVAGVPVRVIKIDLSDPRVQVGVQGAPGFPNKAYSMPKMLHFTMPDIAINGAYASKGTLVPIGDVVIQGKRITTGNMGTVMAITKDKQVTIKRVPYARTQDWSAYETVLGCGPALVLDGKIDVQPRMERFGDPHIMGSTTRMGVGVRENNTLLLVNTKKPVTFQKWAEVMLALKCKDAYNLDAGASTGMFYRGRMVVTPSRHITNMLCVWIAKPMPDISLLVPPLSFLENPAKAIAEAWKLTNQKENKEGSISASPPIR